MIIISINIVVNELKGFLPFLLAKGEMTCELIWNRSWEDVQRCKRTFNISKNFSLYYF